VTNPFDNPTWIRMCLRTGAITPPREHDIERTTRLTAYVVLAVVTIGSLISWMAFAWR
jgi:hypothetical protein